MMSEEERKSPAQLPADESSSGESMPDVLIDPMTGERIFSPKRIKLIEEDLERRKKKHAGDVPGEAG